MPSCCLDPRSIVLDVTLLVIASLGLIISILQLCFGIIQNGGCFSWIGLLEPVISITAASFGIAAISKDHKPYHKVAAILSGIASALHFLTALLMILLIAATATLQQTTQHVEKAQWDVQVRGDTQVQTAVQVHGDKQVEGAVQGVLVGLLVFEVMHLALSLLLASFWVCMTIKHRKSCENDVIPMYNVHKM